MTTATVTMSRIAISAAVHGSRLLRKEKKNLEMKELCTCIEQDRAGWVRSPGAAAGPSTVDMC